MTVATRRVRITHARFFVPWTGAWIYVGSSYLRMRQWEKQLTGQRVSLADEFRRVFDLRRPQFLAWTDSQRTENGDSLHWWMSSLAGRNNAASTYFGHVCQVLAARDYVAQSLSGRRALLVVCEDSFLVQAVASAVQELAAVELSGGVWRGRVYDGSRWAARIAVAWAREVTRCVTHAAAAGITRPRCSATQTIDEVFLVHQCLDEKSFSHPERLQDRYLTSLPTWLEKQGKKVVGLPWLYDAPGPLTETFRSLRANRCFVAEDYLRGRDYFVAFADHCRSVAALRPRVFSDLANQPLLTRERLKQAAAVSHVRFWLQKAALPRWAAAFKVINVLQFYERSVAEHVPIKALRDTDRQGVAVGYYHSLVSTDYLAYHSVAGDWSSSVAPDRVVTNGPLARQVLLAQGAPASRVEAGPSLRQQFVTVAGENHPRDGILVLLSLDLESSAEILDKVLAHAEWISTALQASVRVKRHPMMNRDRFIKTTGVLALPPGWAWEDREIYPALATTYCCIAMTTASVYDAVVAGCVVLPLKRELGEMENGLDLFAARFPAARAVSLANLQATLERMYRTHRAAYQAEFCAMRQELLSGLNPPSDTHLAAFIRKEPVD